MLYYKHSEGLQSGQMLRTVNPSSHDFDGSNPSPSTILKTDPCWSFFIKGLPYVNVVNNKKYIVVQFQHMGHTKYCFVL